MTEESKLPPDVAEAMDSLYAFAGRTVDPAPCGIPMQGACLTVRAELLRLASAEAELAKLRAFARDIMRAWPEGDVDGGELQEIALRHGLLEPSEPTQEERDEWGLDEGDLWYRKTALLGGDNA